MEASAGFHQRGEVEASEEPPHPRRGDAGPPGGAGELGPGGPPGGSQTHPLVAVLTRNDRATASSHFQARGRGFLLALCSSLAASFSFLHL